MLLDQMKILGFVATMGLLTACAPLDDYMFGKDNTPIPEPLGALTAKISVVERWSVTTGKVGNQQADLKLQPMISGRVIYSATADGMVQATDKVNGKVLWIKSLPEHLVSGPTVAEHRIAIASSASTLILLDQSTGDLIWKASLSEDALAKPLITPQDVLAKTIDGRLYAFDLKTGEKRWVVDHGAPHLILKASSSPVIMDKVVLVGFSDGKLDAIEQQTGRVIWQRNIAYASGGSDVERLIDIDADPVIRGEDVYLASYQGYIGALSMRTGEFIWRKPASIYKNILVSGQSLIYVDSESTVWELDRLTGQVKWKQPALKARDLTEPVMIDNLVLVGDKAGYLHGLSLSTGELVSRTALNSAIVAAPIISGKSIYVLTANGKLSRFVVSE